MKIGDVYLRSPMSAGYLYLGGAPLLPSTDDGFRTAGDIGHVDDDGYLYIVDRRVDMIVTGGANVFPAEVESRARRTRRHRRRRGHRTRRRASGDAGCMPWCKLAEGRRR